MTIRRRSAAALTPVVSGRTVTVRLVAWDTPSTVTDDGGRSWYQESFARGGARLGRGRLVARTEHDGAIVGTIDPESADDRDDGLYADVRLRSTSAADDLLVLLDDDDEHGPVIDAVSIEFDAPAHHGRSVTYRNGEAVITGVAFVPDPQHPASTVVAIRSRNGAQHMDTDTLADEHDTDVDEHEHVEDQHDTDVDEVDEVDEAPPSRQRSRPAPARQRSVRRPGAGATAHAFPTFGHYARAVYEASQRDGETSPAIAAYTRALRTGIARRRRALADGVTGDVTSVVRDAWVDEVIDLVASVTPTLSAFASRPLPASGMTVSQPKMTQRPLVGVQAAEKTEVDTRKLTLGLESWEVATYAGGNDLSVQLLERADIDVLNEYMRYFAIEMGEALNAAAVTSVLAAAVATNNAVEMVGTDFNAAVIAASKPILTALHRLPTVCLLSVDMWEVLGNAVDGDGRPLYPGISPTNPIGSFNVTEASGNVRGLSYSVEPELTGTTAVLGVADAWVSRRGGMRTLTADVPAKLGRDVAVYEYAAMGAVDDRGLALIVDEVAE